MSNKVLALIAITLLSGSAAAQQSLYSNPYNPTGAGDCGFSSGCQLPGTQADAQLFDLSKAATVQSVSFTVSEPYPSPENRYEWAIYADKGGLPFGVALASGDTYKPGSGQSNTYSEVQVGGGTGGVTSNLIDTYTFSTGSVNLGPGNYFLALDGFGSETVYQNWMQGLHDTGAASSEYGVWSAGSTGGIGGLALTVTGRNAPEIDPSSTMGGLALLAGGLAVLRGRRPARPVASIA